MSFHEAAKGHVIFGFYGMLHYVGAARDEHAIKARYACRSYAHNYQALTINDIELIQHTYHSLN